MMAYTSRSMGLPSLADKTILLAGPQGDGAIAARLRAAGCRVLEAADLGAAMSLVAAEPRGIDLVLAVAPGQGRGQGPGSGDVTGQSVAAPPAARCLPLVLLSAEAALPLEGRMEEALRGIFEAPDREELELVKKNAERLEFAVEGSGAGIWDWLIESNGLVVNARYAEMLGYSLEELAPIDGNTFSGLLHPEDKPRSDAITADYFAGRIVSHEIVIRLRHKDGHWVWVIDRGKVTERDAAGKPTRMSGVHIDITDRMLAEHDLFLEREERRKAEELRSRLETSLEELKRAQDRLIRSEKMAVLGGLVAGMAHEINTPIGVALTSTTYLEEQARDFSKMVAAGTTPMAEVEYCLEGMLESADLARKNLERAAELVRSFKQLSVDQTSETRRLFPLRPYIGEILQSLRPHLKKRQVELYITCPDDLTINSYPGAFSQIITNLVINSLEHGFRERSSGGRIGIEARLDGPGTLAIVYADDGAGMEAENLKRLFDPFFTTAHDSGGTGLGMTIVYNLVTQRLCGEIEAESSPGAGLSYRIRIPIDSGRAEGSGYPGTCP